nr:MAG TPA: hypothetical protein [Caudoviricetes sp.]
MICRSFSGMVGVCFRGYFQIPRIIPPDFG